MRWGAHGLQEKTRCIGSRRHQGRGCRWGRGGWKLSRESRAGGGIPRFIRRFEIAVRRRVYHKLSIGAEEGSLCSYWKKYSTCNLRDWGTGGTIMGRHSVFASVEIFGSRRDYRTDLSKYMNKYTGLDTCMKCYVWYRLLEESKVHSDVVLNSPISKQFLEKNGPHL